MNEQSNITTLQQNLTQQTTSYKSFDVTTKEQKMLLYKAMNNPDFRLSDYINQTILIQNVFIEMIDIINKETGECNQCPRVVLIDSEGKSYNAVSKGIYKALSNIFITFGEPSTWDEPLKIKIIQKQIGERKMLTLDVII